MTPPAHQVMGIVNINDDSFSGDGSLDIREALATARRMVEQGADIIDIGAESARTNRGAISTEEEISRLLPFLESWDLPGTRISVNTWRPEVVAAVLETGRVWLINDMGGLNSPENARLCARAGVSLLIMHTRGLPKEPHFDQSYSDIWAELDQFFEEKLAVAREAGLKNQQLVLDPGIDFAKQRDDNLTIYRNLERLTRHGIPVLLPVSRKTVIGEVLGIGNPSDRDAGTIACSVRGLRAGAAIFRVHEVEAVVQSLRVIDAIHSASSSRGG